LTGGLPPRLVVTAGSSQAQPIIDNLFIGDINRPGDAQNGAAKCCVDGLEEPVRIRVIGRVHDRAAAGYASRPCVSSFTTVPAVARREYSYPDSVVFGAAWNAISTLADLKGSSADRSSGIIRASTGAYFGENVTVTVNAQTPANADVSMSVSTRTGVNNWHVYVNPISWIIIVVFLLARWRSRTRAKTDLFASLESALKGGWLPDPFGRAELRYWDGYDWTQDVADAGRQRIDPVDVV
jgi:hypothetical protein